MSEFIDEYYVYRARMLNVVDGDTYDLEVDVGFNLKFNSRFRLYGYDTPELRRGSDLEKSQAGEAKKFVICWFQSRPRIYIRTHKADSFGRWLAEVFTEHDDLGEMLVEKKLATIWPTRWRDTYDN